MKKHSLLPLLAAVPCLAWGNPASEETAPLASFGEQLVLPTYESLAEETSAFLKAAQAAAAAPSADTVTKARQAWKEARIPWERSEAFLFGPVDTEGHDPYIDSWPVNVTDLQKVIDAETGPAEIEAATVESFNEGLRGFHVVEYLLFADADGNPASAKAVADALKSSPRRAAYLVAASEALEAQAAALLADYAPGQGDFIGVIASAGDGSEVYLTRGAALSDIANALAGIAEESSQVKLLAPATEGDTSILESRFSENTLQDVSDNIEGIRRAAELVIYPVLTDDALKERLNQAILLYQSRVKSIPSDFNTNPAAYLEAVKQAAEAGAAVQAILEDEVVPEMRSA